MIGRQEALCRPSRRGVDWNQLVGDIDAGEGVAPHAGAWIGTVLLGQPVVMSSRPSRRGVDWNIVTHGP